MKAEIAKFMGWSTRMFQVYQNSEPEPIWFKPGEDFPQSYFREVELLFDSDWNWLILVVEKIESLGYFVMINKWTSVYTSMHGERIEITTVEGKDKLNNTYEAICIFIRQIIIP